jgi:hypothetical protein
MTRSSAAVLIATFDREAPACVIDERARALVMSVAAGVCGVELVYASADRVALASTGPSPASPPSVAKVPRALRRVR